MDPQVELILKVAGVVISLGALLVGVARLWIAVYPIWEKRRERRILNEKFGRGPFDKATIERSTQYYIRPKCSNIDPAQEKEPRHALMATREPLFEKVDHFLSHDDSDRHLLVLADSGMGKTSFVLNYYAYNARRPKGRRHRLALVPLGALDADELITSLPDQEETAIFLDAFDEDTKAIEDHRTRILELMQACRKFRKVVVTCRTQFFPKEEEIPVETGILRVGPLKAGDNKVYEFWKLYLSPFDDEDIERYLRKHYPVWARQSRQRAQDVVGKIPLLSVRPMLLAHIPDVVATRAEIEYAHQLYEVMVDAWLDRETAWADKEALREFSERLAVDIYVNREARGMERVPADELPRLAAEWEIELQPWQMAGRSLLNRDAEGNYKFAHRSIMEYLFVKRLVNRDDGCCGVLLTDQMKRFLVELFSSYGASLEPCGNLLVELNLGCEIIGPEIDYRPRRRALASILSALQSIFESAASPAELPSAYTISTAAMPIIRHLLEADGIVTEERFTSGLPFASELLVRIEDLKEVVADFQAMDKRLQELPGHPFLSGFRWQSMKTTAARHLVILESLLANFDILDWLGLAGIDEWEQAFGMMALLQSSPGYIDPVDKVTVASVGRSKRDSSLMPLMSDVQDLRAFWFADGVYKHWRSVDVRVMDSSVGGDDAISFHVKVGRAESATQYTCSVTLPQESVPAQVLADLPEHRVSSPLLQYWIKRCLRQRLWFHPLIERFGPEGFSCFRSLRKPAPFTLEPLSPDFDRWVLILRLAPPPESGDEHCEEGVPDPPPADPDPPSLKDEA